MVMHIALSHLEILPSTDWKCPTLQTAQETPSYIITDSVKNIVIWKNINLGCHVSTFIAVNNQFNFNMTNSLHTTCKFVYS